MLVASIPFTLQIAECIALGAITGCLSGLLGIGGGVVIVPSLLYIFQHMPLAQSRVMHYAVATSLTVMVCNASVAVYFHHRAQALSIKPVLTIIPSLILGVLLGVLCAHNLSTIWLQRLFALLLFVVAIKLVIKKQKVIDTSYQSKLSQARSNMLGIIVGICSGMLGIGGGVITVPFLISQQWPYRQVITTSLMMTITASLTGTLAYMLLGTHMKTVSPSGFIGDVYLLGGHRYCSWSNGWRLCCQQSNILVFSYFT